MCRRINLVQQYICLVYFACWKCSSIRLVSHCVNSHNDYKEKSTLLCSSKNVDAAFILGNLCSLQHGIQNHAIAFSNSSNLVSFPAGLQVQINDRAYHSVLNRSLNLPVYCKMPYTAKHQPLFHFICKKNLRKDT